MTARRPEPLVDGIDIKYAFVGNAATQYAYQCIWNYQTALTGSLAADGTSWINPNSGIFGESADLCSFAFPGPYHSGSASDPQPPDMKFGGIPYLIQENWVNAMGGYCAIRWDE